MLFACRLPRDKCCQKYLSDHVVLIHVNVTCTVGMLYVQLYNIAFFSFMLILVGCQPSFTSTPNSGNPVYQLQGQTVTLSWSYDPDGRTVDATGWTLLDNNDWVATRRSNGQVHYGPSYNGRAQVSGTSTIRISNLQTRDSGTYQFRVQFTSFNPPQMTSDAQLIVVGKFLDIYFVFTL